MFYTSIDRSGNNILFRGYKNGKPVKEKIWYKPRLFVPSTKNGKYKGLDGVQIGSVDFESMKDANEFMNEHKEITNFKIYGQENWPIQFINDYFGNELHFDRDVINVTTIDIEVYSEDGFPDPSKANHPISAITIKNNIDNVFYSWGIGDYDSNKSVLKNAKIKYTKCEREKDIIIKFLDHWTQNFPDVITGWNSNLFDITYLINRTLNVLDESYAKLLSPWGEIDSRNVIVSGRKHQQFNIKGVQQVDYLDLFRKFGYSYGTQESYKLGDVAHVVLGERKLDYSEYSSLNELHDKDFQKYLDYNIKDVQLVDRFEDKMGLITLAMTIAYKTGVNISAVFGPVGVWDAYIYNELKKENVIVPLRKGRSINQTIEGAFVKNPQVGMHNWICSFDLNSLYPHLMMQYNMSPETIAEQKVENVTVTDLLARKQYNFDREKYCMTAKGILFRKDKQGILPQIIDRMYSDRSEIKKRMLGRQQDLQNANKDNKKEIYQIEKDINIANNQQMAIKILMNSLYGACSNEHFRFFDNRIAESITLSGQLSIQWAEERINHYLNEILKTKDIDYIVAIDTDSLYINFNPLIEKVLPQAADEKIVKFIDKLAEKEIEPLLEKTYKDLADFMAAYQQRMVMKREAIANKGIWTGKKHYILNVLNSEGVQYKEPKIKMTGIEAVRSSTPKYCRNLIEKALYIIMNNTESDLHKFIEDSREEFKNLTPEDVAFPRGVSDVDKYKSNNTIYTKGAPIQVRGSLLYNHMLKKLNLKKYEQISNGDKIRFMYLKSPNPVGENVIAFPNYLPREFGLEKYIDYDKQLEKSFIEPIKTILNAIGWNVEKTNTIEDFLYRS